MMSTEKPKQPTFGELMEEYTTEEDQEVLRRLNDPATEAEEKARLLRKRARKRKKWDSDDVPSEE